MAAEIQANLDAREKLQKIRDKQMLSQDAKTEETVQV